MKNIFIDITNMIQRGSIYKRSVSLYEVSESGNVTVFITFSLADKGLDELAVQVYNALSFISFYTDETEIIVDEDLAYDFTYLRYIFRNNCFMRYNKNSVERKPCSLGDLFRIGKEVKYAGYQ